MALNGGVSFAAAAIEHQVGNLHAFAFAAHLDEVGGIGVAHEATFRDGVSQRLLQHQAPFLDAGDSPQDMGLGLAGEGVQFA